MGDWLDGWARRAARPGDESANGSSGLSRRQLLKRAGVVAGAAWTVPLIQSAVAPAAAVSGAKPPGGTCTLPTDCSTGYCINGICGSLTKNWTGGTCTSTDGSDCWSGICKNGKCQQGPLGLNCRTTTDCQGGANCSSLNICGGTGASCSGNATNNSKCLSGICSGGVCA